MQKSTTIETNINGAAAARSSSLAPILLAAAFGAFMIFAAGIANSDGLHNAAHDARHAFAFPCH
ncbi:CbtB-domain containing protein [Marivibrio halodurans]|uniref:CbtB-domain containing protein n=1 Tax=Marivibrio halodurans TaxID=2039722 RepID=A0A8J7S2I4_9PROT|nr:CbtB domain-containing protein [Marivibrio halodurans]MBP5859085.1 CbtB-domain containing protein [Marivibrio halodurans]